MCAGAGLFVGQNSSGHSPYRVECQPSFDIKGKGERPKGLAPKVVSPFAPTINVKFLARTLLYDLLMKDEVERLGFISIDVESLSMANELANLMLLIRMFSGKSLKFLNDQ
ncbi:MAG: hypothetical protein HC939_21490 [Pleurocapsa sp. SU_5_0]|nr:hypothetical protein [Pleurocapsa sp. SU_5_0]